MNFDVTLTPLATAECDVLVLGTFENGAELTGQAAALDEAVHGALSALINRERFDSKHSQLAEYMSGGAIKAHKVLLVGLGKRDEFTLEKARTALSAGIKRAVALSAKTVSIAPFDAPDCETFAEALVAVTMLITYKYFRYKTEDAKPCPIEAVEVLSADAQTAKSISEGLERGKAIAEAIRFARDLTNCPANIATPGYLADQATAIADEFGLTCRVMEPEQMRKMGMNLVLAVGQGSVEEPRFIALKHETAKATKTVAIVGKGLTFDAGGLCIKPGRYMDTMKTDMAGAAAVLATIRAVAVLKPDVNVLCVIPATENMPGGRAVKPGDIVTAFSGKTVEINDTDAEGRLILADAVAYAEQQNVDEIIDIATLTGACEVALGKRVAGLMGTDQGMVDRLMAAGAAGGEKLWQLPLEGDYEETLNSELADMKNYAPEAGAITAAQFIKRHIKDTPWAHMDIAGPSYGDGGPYMPGKGGTGFGVYTLVNYLLSSAE